MIDGQNERQGEGPKVRRLSDAMRRVRIAEAERTDAMADLHDADRARLELLLESLAGVFAEIPADDDFFICSIAGSVPPRLWIDGTSHVVIGRDRRSYRFLKDTRLGRVVLLESADIDRVADMVTDYVAERVIERERAKDTDFLLSRMRETASPRPAESSTGSSARAETSQAPVTAGAASAASTAGTGQPAASTPTPVVRPRPSEALARLQQPEKSVAAASSRGPWLISAFLFGIAAGALGLIGYAWMQVPTP